MSKLINHSRIIGLSQELNTGAQNMLTQFIKECKYASLCGDMTLEEGITKCRDKLISIFTLSRAFIDMTKNSIEIMMAYETEEFRRGLASFISFLEKKSLTFEEIEAITSRQKCGTIYSLLVENLAPRSEDPNVKRLKIIHYYLVVRNESHEADIESNSIQYFGEQVLSRTIKETKSLNEYSFYSMLPQKITRRFMNA